MKTKDELNSLKKELNDLNKKLSELNDDELTEVVGGTDKERPEFVRGIAALASLKGPEQLFLDEQIARLVPGRIRDIPGSDIKSIDVLKDAASAAIYGSRAAE